MANSRLNQLTVRLSQKTALSLSLLPQPPAASSLLQGFQDQPRPTAFCSLAFQVIFSSNPKQSRGGSRCWQPLPQGRQLKKAKKTQAVCVFLPGFLCSNLWSPDICKHCLLSCLYNVHLTTEKTKVHGGHGAESTPEEENEEDKDEDEEGESCTWSYTPQTVAHPIPPGCSGL